MPDGMVFAGAHAILKAVSIPRRGWVILAYEEFPGASTVLDVIYRVIARHRHRL